MSDQIVIKSSADIEAMRRAGQIHSQALNAAKAAVKPGATGVELNAIAAQVIADAGAVASFLGHDGFPASLCVAVDDAIVHGIPDSTPLCEGQIVGLDLGVTVSGLTVDGATTVTVGKVTPGVERLLSGSKRALQLGLSQVKPGNRVGDITSAIEKELRAANLGIIRELVGHGVGHNLHEPPEIPNVGLAAGRGPLLKPGMTLAIEPMAALGNGRIAMDRDGWTVRTKDGSPAAQFEQTILVTEDGFEALTSL